MLERIFGIDARSLAAVRIGVALLLLADLGQRAEDLTANYTDAGLLPRGPLLAKVLESPWCLSLHLISGAAPVEALLFLAAAGFAVCLALGWHTRLATAVSWFLLLSVQNRNPLLLQGGDILLRMLLFWGMFLPWGDCWAIRQKHIGPRIYVSIGTAGILLQLAFIYWFSSLLKTDRCWFPDFTAVYYALSLEHFTTAFGQRLLPHLTLLKSLTAASLLLEIAGPAAAFLAGLAPWKIRTAIVFSFMAFHACMAACLELGFFPWICSAAWLAFLPGAFWDRIGLPFPSLPRRAAPSSLPTQGLAAFFLLYVLLWNLRSTDFPRFEKIFPRSLNWIGYLTGTAQVWDMFAPAPLKEGGWFVMPGQLRDGSQVDLFRGGQPLDWAKPPLISSMYKNDRWRKYLVLLAAQENSPVRGYYGEYLWRRWNASHGLGQQVLAMQIFLMEHGTAPPGSPPLPARPWLLWEETAGQ